MISKLESNHKHVFTVTSDEQDLGYEISALKVKKSWASILLCKYFPTNIEETKASLAVLGYRARKVTVGKPRFSTKNSSKTTWWRNG